MKTNISFAIGLMSGTSLDGVDLAYVKFTESNKISFQILNCETVLYSTKWQKILKESIYYSKDNLNILDVEYGILLGKTVNEFIKKYRIKKLDFVASHGHTVLHQPQKGITLQMGSGEQISKITNLKVVSDFRTQDIKLGGQGAPLVPIGDRLLFYNYSYCLNLGGFSNVSFKKQNKRIAFDICPVNVVLNFYANKLSFDYDKAGKIASGGSINHQLLEKLDSLKYYAKQPPKSLGLEWVQKEIFPLIDEFETEIPVVLRTFVEHIAIQISKVITKNETVLITGGGAFNSFLIERIEKFLNFKIKLPSADIINFKEALIFSFLGLLRINNKVNCLSSVTGAIKNHSSGRITIPKK